MKTKSSFSAVDLKMADILNGLDNTSLEEIAEYCTERLYQTNDYCGQQGQATDQILVVNSGRVAVEMVVQVPGHSYTITNTTLTEGKVCSWSALVPPHVLTASLKCLETTSMIVIRADDLMRFFRVRPDSEAIIMRNLAGIVSSRLRDSYNQLARLCTEILKEGVKTKLNNIE